MQNLDHVLSTRQLADSAWSWLHSGLLRKCVQAVKVTCVKNDTAWRIILVALNNIKKLIKIHEICWWHAFQSTYLILTHHLRIQSAQYRIWIFSKFLKKKKKAAINLVQYYFNTTKIIFRVVSFLTHITFKVVWSFFFLMCQKWHMLLQHAFKTKKGTDCHTWKEHNLMCIRVVEWIEHTILH